MYTGAQQRLWSLKFSLCVEVQHQDSGRCWKWGEHKYLLPFFLVKNLGHNLVKGNFIWEMRPYTLMTLLTGSAIYKPITIFILLIICMYVWPFSIIIDCYEGEPVGEEYDKPFISGEKLFKNILMKMINIWDNHSKSYSTGWQTEARSWFPCNRCDIGQGRRWTGNSGVVFKVNWF